ncbi:DUF2628 domain-containing protein [Marinicrinis sediminis]|uniref:DUF2628 domain-containing protein n=1 Tax=Marinicrinis sediminis TaxID=1652465 RepID=A0ABW5R6R5_9BACL
MRVILKHYQSGHEIICKKGFSWTTFFFGPFVPIFRGDLKWMIIMLITDILVGIFTVGIGMIVTWIIFASVYNNRYIVDLGKRGYLESERSPLSMPAGEYRIKPEGKRFF